MARLEASDSEPLLEAEQPELQTVFIDNRGEIAVRAIAMLQGAERTAVLGAAIPDLGSLAVRHAAALGNKDGRSGVAPLIRHTTSQTYENIPLVVASAQAKGCDAVFFGYGFLSENVDAVKAFEGAGIKPIGPSSEVIELVGGKDSARAMAQKSGLPLLPGTDILSTYEQARKSVKHVDGYPIMLKARHAGGGTGNKVIENEAELEEHFTSMSLRFDGGIYMEKYIPCARHIEIQIVGDEKGNIVALGERDCSSQRKFQKVIEESPALILDQKTRKRMADQAIKMAKDIHYTNLGTWEFLYDPATKKHYFMEVNPRVQVEHTVTEERFGMNLLRLQLDTADGKKLPHIPEALDNHVIEARLYAEKPEQDFAADKGTLQLLRFPTTSGVRIDKAYEERDTIPQGFDTTIAKYIAVGETREVAREKLVDALANTTISGVSTNRDFLLWLLGTNEFRDNTITTTYIEDAWAKHRRERFRDVEGFLKGGDFFIEPTPRRFIPAAFTQNLTYEKDGVRRSYAEDRETMNDTCAVKYGIYLDNETGVRVALGIWDFKVKAGTMGVEEGNAIMSLFELAQKESIPVVMITTSAGARQEENVLALQQMDAIIAAKNHFPPELFINIYSGLNFGGVTASIANVADIQLAVDGSLIGLTGPDVVARMMGKKGAQDLPIGAHSALDHYYYRNVDVVVRSLEEARERAMGFCAAIDPKIYHPNLSAVSNQEFESTTPAIRYDRPKDQRFPATFAAFDQSIYKRIDKKVRRPKQILNITPEQRLELITNPLRPTAADLLNPQLKIFNSVSPLSNKLIIGKAEQYPAIVGAVARLAGRPVLVLGQQTIRKRDDNNKLAKEYVSQGSRDFRWAQQKIDLAEHLKMPIILIGDTAGASAYLEDEENNISHEIAQFLSRINQVAVPVMSINLGQNGSGGGLTFIRPVDAAADTENALSLVSTIDVQTRIVTGKWPATDSERNQLLRQIHDGTPEGRLRMGQIDAIIPEPVGGAHTDWPTFAKDVRNFLYSQQAKLSLLNSRQLIERRYERSIKAAQFATSRLRVS